MAICPLHDTTSIVCSVVAFQEVCALVRTQLRTEVKSHNKHIPGLKASVPHLFSSSFLTSIPHVMSFGSRKIFAVLLRKTHFTKILLLLKQIISSNA